MRAVRETFMPAQPNLPRANAPVSPSKPWARIEQALRVTDLLLQAGGFSAIVLDMAGIAPEHVSRVPLATWFRYRAAAERTQAELSSADAASVRQEQRGVAAAIPAGRSASG